MFPLPLFCRHLLVLSILLGLAACTSAISGPAQAGAPADGQAAEAAIMTKIDAAIGTASCTTDSQCRTLGVGAKACGGPAAWRPWSTQHTPKAKDLQSLADQLATLQRQRQAQSGMVSTCQYLSDPGAVCQAQRCVLRQTPGSAS